MAPLRRVPSNGASHSRLRCVSTPHQMHLQGVFAWIKLTLPNVAYVSSQCGNSSNENVFCSMSRPSYADTSSMTKMLSPTPPSSCMRFSQSSFSVSVVMLLKTNASHPDFSPSSFFTSDESPFWVIWSPCLCLRLCNFLVMLLLGQSPLSSCQAFVEWASHCLNHHLRLQLPMKLLFSFRQC